VKIQPKKAVIILYPGCIYFEIAAFVAQAAASHKIEVVIPEGNQLRVDEGITIVADANYADCTLENTEFVVIPGGDPYAVIDNKTLEKLLIEAHGREDLVIGGICNGALVLAKAGLLNGKRCTHHCIEKYAPLPDYQVLLDFATPLFASSVYVDTDVVLDQRIVTAKASATRAFADTLLSQARQE
jgi:transcriptional regulator GlxA family with amidase domain